MYLISFEINWKNGRTNTAIRGKQRNDGKEGVDAIYEYSCTDYDSQI